MLDHLPPNPAVMARRQSPRRVRSTAEPLKPEPRDATVSVDQPAERQSAGLPSLEEPVPRPRELQRLPPRDRQPDDEETAAGRSDTTAKLPTRAEQIKTVLAAIGLLALLFHGLRFLALVAQ